MQKSFIEIQEDKRNPLSASILKDLISRGEYIRAFDLGNEYIESTAEPDPDIIKQHALCISKLGMLREAIEMLRRIDDERISRDPELLALLGSFNKRIWLDLVETEPENSKQALEEAFSNYMKGHDTGGNFWCTINAASLALVLGKNELSIELADKVITECWDEYNRHGTTSEFWIPASMAEAYLIKEDYDSAARWYKSARSHVGSSIGQIKTTRTNASMLLKLHETADETVQEILQSIRKLRIVVFAGHRIDRPGRSTPRFPEKIANKVKARLKKKLIEMKLDIGIASAADGADILFHECMQELGKLTHVILPSPIEHFRAKLLKDSGEDWTTRFDKVMEKSNRIEISSASRFKFNADASFQLSSDYIVEYSLDISDAFDAELLPVVIWDKHSFQQPGGTGYIVNRFRKLGYDPTAIPIDDLVKNRTKITRKTELPDDPPYSRLGIYGAIVRPIVVLYPATPDKIIETNASALNRLVQDTSNAFKKKSNCILASGLISGCLYLILDSVDSTRSLLDSVIGSNASDSGIYAVLHAGLITKLESSVAGIRCYHSNEITETIEISKSLTTQSIVASMQFKAIVKDSDFHRESFRYCSLFRSSSGNLLKIFIHQN
jgi:tetratricopeptide (TPR) repeat protein